MSTVDVMHTKLRAAGYNDSVGGMLLEWMADNALNGYAAYQDHVFANATATNFADAEAEFWAAFT